MGFQFTEYDGPSTKHSIFFYLSKIRRENASPSLYRQPL